MANSSNHLSRRHFLKLSGLTGLAGLPVIRQLSKFTGVPQIGPYITAAYRVLDPGTLLNLEFYFIGVCVSDDKQYLFHPDKDLDAFMLVRLPQQHIAEEFIKPLHKGDIIGPGDIHTVQTRIAGYSFLAFQLFFEGNDRDNLRVLAGEARLRLEKKNLMDWNAPWLKLIVREDRAIDQSIFVERPEDNLGNHKKVINRYPLGYHLLDEASPKRKFDLNSFPKAPEKALNAKNPSPFSAIEAPYRLILSPELPNHSYTFRWYFSRPEEELWMATLKIIPNPSRAVLSINTIDTNKNSSDSLQAATVGHVKTRQKKTNPRQQDEKPSASKDTISPATTTSPAQQGSNVPVADLPMGLAMIGSADDSTYIKDQSTLLSADSLFNSGSLPHADNRNQLVTLYFLNRSILKAYTKQFSLTALGVSTRIEFQNSLLQKIQEHDKHLNLYQWKQWISFGRDIEVQVVRQVKDLCFCHTMLYIEMTKRITVDQVSVLELLTYMVPLDHQKDYTTFNPEDKDQYLKESYKYNTPFKNIRFANLKPKQIKNVQTYKDQDVVLLDAANPGKENNAIAFWPLAPASPDAAPGKGIESEYLNWEYIATDWDDKETVITRKMYVVGSEFMYSTSNGSDDAVTNSKNNNKNIILSDLKGLKQLSQLVTNKDPAVASIHDIEEKLHDTLEAISGTTTHWHQVYLQSEQYLMEKSDMLRSHIANIFSHVDTVIQNTYAAHPEWIDGQGDVEEAIHNFQSGFYQTVQQKMELLNPMIAGLKLAGLALIQDVNVTAGSAVRKVADAFYHYAALPGTFWKKQLAELKNDPMYANVRVLIDNLTDKFNQLLDQMAELDRDIDGFLSTLPSKLPIAAAVRAELVELKEVYCFVEHAESACKSKVNAYKSEIAIAVHKVEKDFEQAGEQFRQKIGSEWESVYKTADDYYHKANKAISNIATEALIFKSNVRSFGADTKQKVMDFFHPDATRLQLHSLQGFVSKVNDTVQKEVPLRLTMAAEYLKCQADNTLFTVENNANLAFARIHAEAKQSLKAAMRNIGSELGGMINPEMASDLLSYYHDAKAAAADAEKGLDDIKASKIALANQFTAEYSEVKSIVSKQISRLKYAPPEAARQVEEYMQTQEKYFKDQFNRQKNKLVLIGQTLQSDIKNAANQVRDEVKNDINNAKQQALDLFKGLEAKILGSIKLKDILHIDTPLPKMNKTNKSIYYEFITNNFLRSISIGSIELTTFNNTRLVCYFEKSLTQAGDYLSRTRLENFQLGIFDGRLIVTFKSLEIVSDRQTKNKTHVEIGDVKFQKELAFLDALSKNIKVPGTGIVLNIKPDAIVASYSYTFPGITAGAFTMTNLKFNVGLTIPFPTGGSIKPVRVSLGINAADDQFVIAVTIYGGRGHFVLETTPRYISLIDCGLEFGGYLGLNLGIAQGQAYLMAGIRYVFTRDNEGQSSMHFYGYVTCGGSITVFGFITISVCFLLCMEYQKSSDGSSSLIGSCTLTLSVKIGFFEKSFSLTFTKTFSGTDSSSKQALFYRHLHEATPDQPMLVDAQLNGFIHYADYHVPSGQEDYPGGDKRLQPPPHAMFTEEGWKQFCKSFYYQ